ncbi:hypothetical protein F2Q69_00005067 [Brassica cretica]|uniref:PORR domain-containing protein n=1 Tax=Brassica cretica TaxID=69181 RepID=A0A8S9PGK0_BRACR|nr:hypothetical protein F2Q69_00005067 [Brassica cretica]
MHILPQHRKPMNYYATKSLSTLCVRMTSAASSLSMQELNLKSDELATKLQKLLMLSSHRRLLLSKLVHTDLVQDGKRIKREGRSKGANKSMDDEYSNDEGIDDDYNSDLGGDD